MNRSRPALLLSLATGLLLPALASAAPAEPRQLPPAEVVFDPTPIPDKQLGKTVTAPAVYLQMQGADLVWNGTLLERAGRQTYIAGLVRESGAVYLILTADGGTRLGDLAKVLDELRTTGVTKILIRPQDKSG